MEWWKLKKIFTFNKDNIRIGAIIGSLIGAGIYSYKGVFIGGVLGLFIGSFNWGNIIKRKKKKETIWEKIKWNLYLKKIVFKLKLMDFKNRRLKSKYCKKGFHRFKNNYISLTSYRKKRERTIRSDFFECRICGLLIFSTDKDKRNWLLIKKHKKATNKELVELMLRDIKKKK